MEKIPPAQHQHGDFTDYDAPTQPHLARRNNLVRLIGPSVSFIAAALASLLFFMPEVSDNLDSTIINVGMDPQRADLITALLLVAGAALVGTFIGRNKFAAWLGASLVFAFDYLYPFIQQQLRPFFDPAGNLEPLDTTVLTHTSFVLASLGLLSAFVGSAVGASLAETLLDQIAALLHFLWQRLLKKNTADTVPARPLYRSPWHIGGWLATLGMLALIFFASNSVDLFVFSPDINIHSKPFFKTTGTILSGSYVSPALHNQRRAFEIYLPASYNTPAGKHKHYPVLYALHGSPGKPSDWFLAGKASEDADALISAQAIPELIIVSPDGNGRHGATSEWANSGDGRQLLENSIAFDLVHYIDTHYRTIPNAAHRAIAGNSMGAFGAMNIAIHHPNIFGNVLAMGAYFRAEGTIWGSSIKYRRANSPILTIATTRPAQKLHIFLGAATKDQPYYSDTKEFINELKSLHIPYHFDLQKGYHSWLIWQKQMYDGLAWLPWK